MLPLPARRSLYPTLIGLLLCGSPVTGLAKEPYRVLSQMNDEIAEKSGQSRPGAPQVLEIPPIQDPASFPPAAPPVETSRRIDTQTQADEALKRQDDLPPAGTTKRSYLGLVYVSFEEEGGGVEVLDVLVGSPAARAGFVGSRTSSAPSRTDQLFKIAMAGLIMSPAAPFAVPLVIAHEMFLACRPRGDVILAVGDRPIRDAVELNEEIHQYHPGDQVKFSIVRCRKTMQITAQMGDEDLEVSGEEATGQPPSPPESPKRIDGASFLFKSSP